MSENIKIDESLISKKVRENHEYIWGFLDNKGYNEQDGHKPTKFSEYWYDENEENHLHNLYNKDFTIFGYRNTKNGKWSYPNLNEALYPEVKIALDKGYDKVSVKECVSLLELLYTKPTGRILEKLIKNEVERLKDFI